MQTIDCLGEICPVPILKLQAVLKKIKEGEDYLLVTDHSCSVPSVQDFCRKYRLTCQVEEVMNGVWEIRISR